MIPEKWGSVYLYASIIDRMYQMPIGEMFFYYIPKGILKRAPVNVYEIPSKFNIDEKYYLKLVKNLYGSIEQLRNEYKKNNLRIWTNLTIIIENFKFKVIYNYEPLDDSEYSSHDRHIIWKYKYLKPDIHTFSKKERKVIEKYLVNSIFEREKEEIYEESVYKKILGNTLNYNQLKFEKPLELDIMEEFEENRKIANNQILADIESKHKKKMY